MDGETFFDRIRGSLIDRMNKELMDLGSSRKEMKDENGNIIGVNRERFPFNSSMMEIFQGSDLDEIFARMKTQIEDPAV